MLVEPTGVIRNECGVEVHELLAAETIRTRVRQLGEDIAADHSSTPILIANLKGAWIFMADLVRSIRVPVECDFLRVSSYGMGTDFSDKIELQSDILSQIEGREVILVEDIADRGEVLGWLVDWVKKKNPANVKTCCLLSKPARRTVDARIDYLGFEIPDRFVIGYGLDLAERFRGLPYVGFLVSS